METSPLPVLTNLHFQTSSLFSEYQKYFSELRLYYHLFQKIPCVRVIPSLDAAKAKGFLLYQLNIGIQHHYFRRDGKDSVGGSSYWIEILQLTNGMLVSIDDSGDASIMFVTKQEKIAEEIVQRLIAAAEIKRKAAVECAVYLVVVFGNGLGLEKIVVPKMQVCLSRNYVPEVSVLFKQLRNFLRRRQQTGLILLQGAPGTGKTSFIQYLLARQPRKALLLSPDMARDMDKPTMLKLLCENQRALLVLEDAEELIVTRDQNRSSAIATLLNLSDGLIGRGLGIIVIATFNAPVKTIDPALLRKGRLLAIYEFQSLPADQATRLLQHLGINVIAKKPMTLADIYSYENDSFQFKMNTASAIGFRAAHVIN